MKKEELMNKVILKGEVFGNIKQKYVCYGEQFYEMNIKVERRGRIYVTVSIVISEFVLGKERLDKDLRGNIVVVKGKLNSRYKEGKDKKLHPDLFIYAHEITFCEEEQRRKKSEYVHLRGTVHKEPVFRRSYLQNIPITNLLISVPDWGNKVNLIPCIAWKEEAIKAKEFKIGEQVEVEGLLRRPKVSKGISKLYKKEVSIFNIIDEE